MSKVELKNVSKLIINKKTKTGIYVLYDVTTIFPDEKISVILGASGCGKTMLLKSIAGIEKIDNGEIYFDDIASSDINIKDRNISYLSQNYALYPHLTVFENIAYPLTIQKLESDEIKRRVKEMIDFFKLDKVCNLKPKNISGGERQRAAFARALIKRPSLLLLDEPLSNIDESLRSDIIKDILLMKENFNLTIIYVTHNLREAYQLSDEVYVMDNGTIVENGKINDLIKDTSSFFYQNFINIGE